MKIGIDVDGVLADFESGFAPILTRLSGVEFPLDDMNFPPVWGWPVHYMEPTLGKKEARAIENLAWREVETDPLFWQTLKPIRDTQRVLSELSQRRIDGDDIYFITHRFGDQAKLQTERWLTFMSMPNPTVLRTGDKGPVVHGLNLDCFIDDKPGNCITVRDYVAESAGSTRVYLCDRPYNRDEIENVTRVSGVLEMLERECGHAEPGPGELSEAQANG